MAKNPCCERMGMRKGPWSAEEDQILISHIQTYGHGNWRALPKQAGEHKLTLLKLYDMLSGFVNV